MKESLLSKVGKKNQKVLELTHSIMLRACLKSSH
ncbi:hypothetical protein RHABOEDO_000490 [Candidatus Rhabdochlamydia oedothoracis]|uniref:Uncharacterized protein n=1 Tax=Candidatus Rhabdochlamydia oedothoracis TaxID=2720720 RepID=A0ABX8UZL3_9BACT|nr:hypothetical protein RHOW815_001461 [Candidatus Rhabdochlamydia sp. W815]QYF48351.1 hypothetical protein RHABOEDO_000490 [Candidatus Rhabdochlamydia oedothoracis]